MTPESRNGRPGKGSRKRGKLTQEGIIYWPPGPCPEHIKCFSELSAKGVKMRTISSQPFPSPTGSVMPQEHTLLTVSACACKNAQKPQRSHRQKVQQTLEVRRSYHQVDLLGRLMGARSERETFRHGQSQFKSGKNIRHFLLFCLR